MSKPIAYGIDFGTTNSSIAVAYDDGVEIVPVNNGSPVLPSIINLDATGNQLAGDAAVQQFLAGAGTGRLMSSLKSYLTDDAFDSTEVYGVDYTMPSLVAVILRALKMAADRHTGQRVDRVVLGHPVLFVGAAGDKFEQLQRLAIARLDEAAQEAGFREVEFFDEPSAALLGEELEEGHLLSVDFGGGTFDVSVAHVAPDAGEVLAIHGAAIGGELFDSLLFDAKLADALGLTQEYVVDIRMLPVPWTLKRMRTMGDCLRMVADTRTWTALDMVLQWKDGGVFKTIEALLRGGHGYSFFQALEAAKVALSDVEETAISFSRPQIRINEPVTRREFNALIAGNLDVVDDQIAKAMADAGLTEDDIDIVVRTGGSSRIPAFIDRLSERFGAEKLAERDAFTTVAEGLAMRALQTFGGRS